MYIYNIMANVHIGVGEYIHAFLLQQSPHCLWQDLIEKNGLNK